jgi:hypothetical protein
MDVSFDRTESSLAPRLVICGLWLLVFMDGSFDRTESSLAPRLMCGFGYQDAGDLGVLGFGGVRVAVR